MKLIHNKTSVVVSGVGGGIGGVVGGGVGGDGDGDVVGGGGGIGGGGGGGVGGVGVVVGGVGDGGVVGRVGGVVGRVGDGGAVGRVGTARVSFRGLNRRLDRFVVLPAVETIVREPVEGLNAAGAPRGEGHDRAARQLGEVFL